MRRLLQMLLAAGLAFLPPGDVHGQQSGAANTLDRMLDVAGVKPGMVVGEIGAGTGDLAVAMAARVGGYGRVYANDISKAALQYIADRKVSNVVTVLGTTDDPAFPNRDLDLVIMKNTFHDLENPLSLLEHARTYLKPGAPMVLIEPTTTASTPAGAIAFHNMTADQILGIVARSSFRVVHTETVGTDRPMTAFVLHVVQDRTAKVWASWVAEFQTAVDQARQIDQASPMSADRKRVAWERVLDAHRDDAPGTDEDDRLRREAESRIASLKGPAARATSNVAGARRLRSAYRRLEYEDIEAIVASLGFTASIPVRTGDYANQYERRTVSGDPILADHASGLLWHPFGSDVPLDHFAAQEWIDDLNGRRYAGRSDWRLPTVDELLTLLETAPPVGNARLAPLFSDRQLIVWTGDDARPGRAWVVNFGKATATVWDVLKTRVSWVRPVSAMTPDQK